MKLCSWNVNGIRAVTKKGSLQTFVETQQPDVLCLQETKATADQISFAPDGYYCYWHSADQKGYSGTGILSKQPLEIIRSDLGVDPEGRVMAADLGKLYLVTTYVPNSGAGLKRLEYRIDWDFRFREFLEGLQKTKPIILCGDLNVAHNEIDLARPDANRNRTAGFTDAERESFGVLLKENNLFDSFRSANPDAKDAYSYWSYRTAGRKHNIGWRLDYFCVDFLLQPQVSEPTIFSTVLGSDHCPVGLTYDA